MRTMTVKQYLALSEDARPQVYYKHDLVKLVYPDPSYSDNDHYVVRLSTYGAGSKRGTTLLEYADAPGTFSVILADPPWPYSFSNTRGAETADDYPRLTVDEIKRLRPLASDNCALFLWATGPLLPQALEVIDAWRFEYKTIAWVWVKLNPSGNGYWNGMGAIRANSEPCLLAVRGRMPVAVHDVSALIIAPIATNPATGKPIHSAKPDEQYSKIMRLYPRATYLEMFARRRRAGWEAHGNEIKDGITIEPMADDTAERYLAEAQAVRQASEEWESNNPPAWEGTEEE